MTSYNNKYNGHKYCLVYRGCDRGTILGDVHQTSRVFKRIRHIKLSIKNNKLNNRNLSWPDSHYIYVS